MSPRTRHLIPAVIILVIFNFFCHRATAQSQNKDEFQPGKLFARVSIGTNHVELGVTQTESSPSVQALLGYKWEQFRIGLWGSNVKFGTSNESVNLRLFAAYRFIFTSRADLTVRYDMNKYYNSSTRDGSITGLDLNLFDYHVKYDKNDNWEGTDSESVRYGFEKEFSVSNGVLLGTGVGYNMVDADSFTNYFDARASLGYTLAEIKCELIGTLTSNSSQFGGHGGPFLFVNFSATF